MFYGFAHILPPQSASKGGKGLDGVDGGTLSFGIEEGDADVGWRVRQGMQEGEIDFD